MTVSGNHLTQSASLIERLYSGVTGPFFKILVGLLVASAASNQASAQPVGSLVGRRAEASDLELVMSHLTRCIHKRQPAFVDRLLKLTPGSRDENKLAQRFSLDFEACFDERARLQPVGVRTDVRSLRGRLAFEALRAKHGELGMTIPIAESTMGYAAHLATLKEKDAVAVADVVAHRMAMCVARADWSAAASLVISMPGSPAELFAAKQLNPSLGRCLLAKQTLKTTRRNLRDALSEAMYNMLENKRA